MESPKDKKDYCTAFPESWLGKDISECCKKHDATCSTRKFYRCLKSKLGWFHSSYIALGGSLGCWVKYTRKMLRRV